MTTNESKSETIRTWYDRTTRKTRKIIGWTSIIGAVSAVFFFFYVPPAYTLRLQVFNGAWVIPIAALIWIVAFVWIFLIPSREVGFRSQEALDRTTEMLKDAVETSIKPALEVWQRLGRRLEAELEAGLLVEFREAIKTLRETAQKVQASTESSTGDLKATSAELRAFTSDVKPAIDALKRIQTNLEHEIKDGFFDQARLAMESIRHLGGGPASKKGPDLNAALHTVGKKPAVLPKSPAVSAVVTVSTNDVAQAAQGSAFPQGPLPAGPVPVAPAPGRIDKLTQV